MSKIKFNIGNKIIGDGNVLIQSMGDIKTSNVSKLVEETNFLAERGLDMMRFSVLDKEDALALKDIKKNVNIPIIADIHFDYNLALLSINSGVDKIRINPGNITDKNKIKEIVFLCKEKNIPIRIGVNSGSLNKYRGKGKNQIEDILLELDETIDFIKSLNFNKIVLSLKSSNPDVLYPLYKEAYTRYDYPLHIGLTESGYGTNGAIKSAIALYPLLMEGIGDTIRISLADERIEELRACKTLLKLTKRRNDLPELVVCPSCGRTLIDLKPISRIVQEKLDTTFKNIKIAVMGCPVNGIGEAKDATYGIAGSGKKDCYLLFSKGKEIGIYPKEKAIKKLFDLIDNY